MIPLSPLINNQIPIIPQLNNRQPTNFQQQFTNFIQNFQQNSSISPQQVVQNMLNNGQMSQEQFNQCRQMANMLTGKNL